MVANVIDVFCARRLLRFNGRDYRCAIGRGGAKPAAEKREGDGATPLGLWPLRQVFFRADRLEAPQTKLPLRALTEQDGWCDDPAAPEYNRLVRLPFAPGHEEMWRADGLYDVVVVLGHNDAPPVPGMGSAIFLHVASADYAPTAGCVALALADLLELLAALPAEAALKVSD